MLKIVRYVINIIALIMLINITINMKRVVVPFFAIIL